MAAVRIFMLFVLVGAAQAQSVEWSRDLTASLKRARTEGRPILIAINALDTESGNQSQLHTGYRTPGLVETTRPMICLVANPNNHDRKGTCARYGFTDCATHKAVLAYALRRWSNEGNLISPQHMVLAPDGTLLWRQEYLIGAGPLQLQCEKALVKTAPELALRLAAQSRRHELKSLLGGADLKPYLDRNDPLAPAVLLLAWEQDESDKWINALKKSQPEAFGLVRLYLEDEPVFLKVAKAIDGKKGAWWQKRLKSAPAKVPPPANSKLRRAFLALKKGDKKGLGKLVAALAHPVDGPEVRAALAELAGVDHGYDPAGWKEQFGK